MGQVRVQSSLSEPSWALLSQWGALILVLVLVHWLQGLQLSCGGVDLSGAQVSPLVIGLSAALCRPCDITKSIKNLRHYLSDTVSQEVMSVCGVPCPPVSVNYGRKRICENCL